MFKDKWLAIKANPKRAVLYAVGLTVLLALLISGIVSAAQGAKETARREAEQIAIQAQQAEQARLAAEEAERALQAAIKAQEEERARLAAIEAERVAAEAAEKAAEEKRIADAKAAANAKAAADAAKAKLTATKASQDGYCFVFPAYIRPYLGSGSLPDGATVDGHKHVCKSFEKGGKDKPSKNASEQNKKGHVGGACYDWDETPNLKACYPTKYYGKLLNNFLDNNTPEKLKENGGKLKFKKP